MKLTEKQTAVVNYLRENGRVTMTDLCAALNTDAKHLNPVITTLGVKGPKAKGLCDYEKVAVEGEEQPVKYVFLTEAGLNYTPDSDEE
jgi:DNA-binding MarR family transcriptional regulator